ncbi:MAG: HDIG domain-containing metalloprotein [Bacteroidales bacterium]|nr:HDIG domain-containing protein [Bacteroidales bacterium]MDD4829722.1 HDIG domain-containing protein [Bacteroidales bacterium]
MKTNKTRFRKFWSSFVKILLMLISSAIIVLIFPTNETFKYDFQKGGFWEHETLISPFDITLYKTSDQLLQEKEAILSSKKLYFDIQKGNFDSLAPEIQGLPLDYIIYVLKDTTAFELRISEITTPLKLNQKITQKNLDLQLNNISPIKKIIKKGDQIIVKGELIDDLKYEALTIYKNEYEKKFTSQKTKYKQILGQFLLVSLALIAMLYFFKYIIPELYKDIRKIILILSVIILMVLTTALIIDFNTQYIYVAPLCLTPILIRTFFDSRSSLYVFLVNIIIIGFSVPHSFEFVFYQLMVGMMVIISMEHLKKRGDFFKTSLFVFFTYSIIYVALTLIQDADLSKINPFRFSYFAINAALTLLAFPLIFVFEKLFGYVSELSLLEYSDTNSKVLRELSVKAPGTFQHCVQVANIAEDLIHQIGGNALLTRVGALHHDIGKTLKPLFYIENQHTGFNPHNEINNEESAQIITSHVVDGVRLAHKYKLPDPIIDFIRTHHGSSKTKYFYNKQKLEHPNIPIDENLFTYMGPKPFSRETAVVMMVDSVEAASRSLSDHTEKSLSDLVDNIIDEQIKTNQLSNADITFRDITAIKQNLKLKLQAIYHTRIKYPVSN